MCYGFFTRLNFNYDSKLRFQNPLTMWVIVHFFPVFLNQNFLFLISKLKSTPIPQMSCRSTNLYLNFQPPHPFLISLCELGFTQKERERSYTSKRITVHPPLLTPSFHGLLDPDLVSPVENLILVGV